MTDALAATPAHATPAPATPSRRVVVLHGYNAHPGKHWFDWLAADLADDGITVTTPALPDSAEPQLGAWVAAAREAIGTPDDGLVVIGHSLGSITAVKALAGLTEIGDTGGATGGATSGAADWRLGGLILVAGFDRHLANLPGIDGFTDAMVNYAPIIRNTRSRRMIVSDDDDIVDPAYSYRLAAALEADVEPIAGGGHFREDDGYTSFPEVARAVRAIIG